MRKLVVTLAAVSALALGACQSKEANQVENEAEAQSDMIEAQADAMPAGAASDAAESRADQVEAMGDAKADAIDDGAMTADPTGASTVAPAATR